MSLLLGSRRPYSHLEDDDDFLHHEVDINRQTERQKKNRLAKVVVAVFICITVVLAASIITLLAVLGRLSVGKSKSNDGENILATTKCGVFVGGVEDGGYVFKGIPYAEPPVGKLRWRKPIPLWTDSKLCEPSRKQDSKNFAPPCYQLNPYTRQYEGSENCLYLNVWTPSLKLNASLNVMLWIHGGFLQFGSGHQRGLSPSGRLAKHLNTVFVSFNYRLHALGFLALDMLQPDRITYGNYGFWDQVEVLRWVSTNIRSFGGDPDKVTVFGADVGGTSILAFMTSPVTRGLFQSAWIIGPSMIFNRTLEDASKSTRANFLQRTGCGEDADCLRKLTAKEVIAIYLGKDDPSFRVRDQNDLPIQGIYPEQLSVIDGELVTISPEEAFQIGQFTDVPVLIGTAAQAVDIWPGPDDVHRWDWNQYRRYVITSLDSFSPRVSQLAVRTYNASLPIKQQIGIIRKGECLKIENEVNLPYICDEEDPVTPEYVYTTMVSDVRQTCPVNSLAELMSSYLKSPIYRHIITSKPSKPARIYDYGAVYSFHMWDVVSFFDKQEKFVGIASKEDLEFRDCLQKVVMDFVRSGGKTTGVSGWSRYPQNLAVFSETVTIEDSYSRTKCKFWESQGFHLYTWVS